MLNRSIKKIYSTDNANKQENLTFADILATPNIVLLGEPGAGKTHLFTTASQHENGKFITARSFACNADDTYTGNPVYIDALDEKRSRGEQIDSISEIIRLVRQYKPAKVRISCRAADWLGETDLELFKPYFDANGGYCVVALEALTEAEIDQILVDHNINDPFGFRETAYSKGVSSLLNNPQTLIMLARLVSNGQWPKSKNDLYKNATKLLLTEHNKNHQHKPLAHYAINELKQAAGAACAILLIADIEAISLLESENFPYTEIPYPKADTVLAALTKRAFVSVDQEQVTYSHRTIAEYLAVCWLVKAIRNGLPISRVCSLLCVDGHPAHELRGLYAWLTQLLPEHADILMATDPYGVLVQGDVACLTLSSRKALLNALVKLAENDPWFRGNDWTSEPLGSLSIPEMADEFKALLAREPKQFHLRSLVLDAISHGEPQLTLENELLEILCDDDENYGERSRAYAGLVHAIPCGKELVVKAVRERLQSSNDDLRLKETILADMFSGNFGVDDVAQFIDDYASQQKEDGDIGGLCLLIHGLPLHVLPELLDRISQVDSEKYEIKQQLWYFNYDCLNLVLLGVEDIEIARLWSWLSKIKFSSWNHYRNEDEIKDWFIANPNSVIELFKIALIERGDLNIFGFWNDFQQLVSFAFDIEQIIDTAFTLIEGKTVCDETDQFIFSLVLSLVLRKNTTTDISKFYKLNYYSQSHPELAEIYSCFIQSKLFDWHWKKPIQNIEHENRQLAEQNEQHLANEFEMKKDAILSGKNRHDLGVLAQIYFSSRVSSNIRPPEELLESKIGSQNVEFALRAFKAVLNWEDLPTTSQIIQLYHHDKLYSWWYAILAGLAEHWYKEKNLNLPESTLRAALTLSLLYPVFYVKRTTSRFMKSTNTEPPWQETIFQQHPRLVQTVYLEVIKALLKAKKQNYIQGIRDICQHPDLSINRSAIVLRLLTDYPNAPTQELKTLLLTAVSLPEIASELLLLIQNALQLRTKVRLQQKALWLCAGFLMDFEQFKDTVLWCVTKRVNFVWTLISFLDQLRSHSNKQYSDDLSSAQLDFLIDLIGKRFPNVEHRMGISSGSQNPCDAADFVKRCINQLSAQTDKESIIILSRLIDEPDLDSYRDHLKHAFANQLALLRKQRFDRPNWQQAIESLRNGKPAHITDFHALTVEHLKDVANRITNENADIFKFFWNEDSYGRITEPKPEESCRDKLVELLRPKFAPFNISVEPEGHMARDKRADIVLKYQTEQTLPIEVKRDYHADLWTACENQLDRLYTRDPQAKDYGIYLVFWFGEQRPHSMPNPPKGLQKPKTAQELEIALGSLIKPEDQHRLAVVVIDVTQFGG